MLLALLTAGLVLQGVSVYLRTSGYLHDGVDDQLAVLGKSATQYATSITAEGQTPSFNTNDADTFDEQLAQSGALAAYAEVRDRFQVVTEEWLILKEHGEPRLPEVLPVAGEDPRLFTIDGGSESNTDWRVWATQLPGDRGYLAFAEPLEDVSDIVGVIAGTELLGGAVVLVVLSIAGLLLVRRGLRPLDDMGRTALVIGEGELSRRVEPDDTRTEVGRLGHALNQMFEQLENSFAQRQATEEKLRRFIADASHELRTPLTAIRGYAEMFRRGAADDPADLSVAMRRIESESIRMSRLVEELLLLARLDEHRVGMTLPAPRTNVDLLTLVADAVADARATQPDRTIIVASNPPDLAQAVVHADEHALRQVLGNLLANVARHTPPDATATVRVRQQEERIRVDVVDTGPGIDATSQAQVFERFWRADTSRSRASGGTGLGLAIVAAIVTAHDGTVGVDSELGQGTTFWFELPAADSQETLSVDSATAKVDPLR